MNAYWVRFAGLDGGVEVPGGTPATGDARVLRKDGAWIVEIDGWRLEAEVQTALERRVEEARGTLSGSHRIEALRAPMPGIVVKVAVAAGQAVQAGDLLLVLEAMKMANEIRAPHAAEVRAVRVSQGLAVASGEVLLELG